MIRLNLSFQSSYSRIQAIIRIVLFPILIVLASLYLILIVGVFYVLCLFGLITTIITKQYPNYAAKWATLTGQYLLRIQMFFLGLNDNYPSPKLGYSVSDLLELEVDKQVEYSRLLSIVYLVVGWMLIVPQLIWFAVYSLYVFLLSIVSFVYLQITKEHLGLFINSYIYYARFSSKLFVYFTGLRQEYPTFDLSSVDY